MRRVIIAACVLSVLYSCGEAKKSKDKETEVKSDTVMTKSDGLVIAYFENDSIPEHFDFYKKTLEVLAGKQKSFEAKLMQYQNELQSKASDLQRKYESQSLSPAQLEAGQRGLEAKQQNIAEYQQSVGGKLQEEEFESTKLLINKMEMYSKEYAKKNGITLLLYKQKGGQVLYADSTMDVTMDFIKYMNEREKALDEGK